MKQRLLKILIHGLLTTLIYSCGSDKSEKITFPIVKFIISATSDTTLFGDQGTRIFIEKGTFQFIDGTPVKDSIKIELKEFYKKSDILLTDLSTESNGKLLETGGMLNITATSKGQDVEIKSDKRIVVHFPKPKDNDKQMNLFFADITSSDSTVTNWNIDTISLFKTTLKLFSWGYEWPSQFDSTKFEYIPKNFIDTGYYWHPLDFYLSTYNFSKSTIDEISSNSFINVEFKIDENGKIIDPYLKNTFSDATEREILSFMNNLPEFNPGIDNKGNIVKITGSIGISTELIPLYKSPLEYINSFDKKYSNFESVPIKNMNDAELNYYIFSVAKLGWINCDLFIESEKNIDFIVRYPTERNIDIKMVFNDINGVLIAKEVDGKYQFSNVPLGRQVTIVGIKNVNGKFQTAFQNLTISDQELENLTFKETTLSELKLELEKFN